MRALAPLLVGALLAPGADTQAGCGTGPQQPNVFRVGSLFPMFRALDEQLDRGGVQRFHGFLMAVREINDKSDGVLDDVLPGVTIRHAARDSKRDTGFAFFGALYLTDRAFDDTGVHAYVGAASSGPSINAARISTEFGVPQVSYSSTSVELSDSEQFPLFMRLPPSDEFQGKAMAELVQHLGWREVVTISSSGGYGLAGIEEFQKAAELGTEIVLRETFTGTDSGAGLRELSAAFDALVRRVKASGVRVVVFFGNHAEGYLLLTQAALHGMAGPGSRTQWIMPDAIATNPPPVEGFDPSVLSGLITLRPRPPMNAAVAGFINRFRSQPATGPGLSGDSAPPSAAGADCSAETDEDESYPLYSQDHDGDAATAPLCSGLTYSSFSADGSDINLYAAYAYDSVVTLALALDSLLSADETARQQMAEAGTDADDGSIRASFGAKLYAHALNLSFDGVTGRVSFNQGEDVFDCDGQLVTGDDGSRQGEDCRRIETARKQGDRAGGIMYSVLNYKTPPFGLEEVAVWGAETSIELVGNFSYATSDNAKPLSRLCVDGVRDRLCADGVECVWAECQASAVQEETLVVVWAVLAGVVCVSLAAWGKRTPRYRRFVMLHRIRRAKPLMTQRWKPDGEAVDVPLGAGLSDEQLRSLRQSLGWLQVIPPRPEISALRSTPQVLTKGSTGRPRWTLSTSSSPGGRDTRRCCFAPPNTRPRPYVRPTAHC